MLPVDASGSTACRLGILKPNDQLRSDVRHRGSEVQPSSSASPYPRWRADRVVRREVPAAAQTYCLIEPGHPATRQLDRGRHNGSNIASPSARS
jgi:hypothetical protein